MESEVRYGGFWRRAVATILDSLWLYGIIYLILWFIIGPGIFSSKANFNLFQFVFEWVLPAIVVMGFWIKKAATPGKMLFKMKIVDAKTHSQVPATRLFLRYLAYFLSMIPFGLGLLWVAWDKRKQGWHDKIAGTVIIRDV
jgi:uncharacterized RDD family membrane protein YckC